MPQQNLDCKVVPCKINSDSFVFISYAHADSEVVFPIIEGVNAAGYAIWSDRGINISSTWTDEIANAILNCSAFVIFITKASMASQYVRSEVEFALNQKLRIIPVYIDGLEVLPPGLALGLNSTQGITDVDDTEVVTSKIINALEYNNIAKIGAPVSVSKPKSKKIERSRPVGKPLPVKAIVAVTVLVVLAVSAVFILRPLLSGTGGGGPEDITAPVSGADGTAQSAEAGTVKSVAEQNSKTSFTVNKSSYARGEKMVVDASAVIRDDGGENYLYIAEVKAKPNQYLSYANLNREEDEVRFDTPAEEGDYEVRQIFYANNEYVIVARCPFKVDENLNLMGLFDVSVDKTSYMPGETITVTVSGLSKEVVADGPYLCVSELDSAANTYMTYVNLKRDEDTFYLNAPKEHGDYVVRALPKGSAVTKSVIVTEIAFTVEGTAEGMFEILADKTTYRPFERVVITASGLDKAKLKNSPTIYIAEEGGKYESYISYARIKEDGEKLNMNGPGEAGVYEVRAFYKDSVTVKESVADMVNITVEGDWLGAYEFTVEKTTFAPEEEIKIKCGEIDKVLTEFGSYITVAAPDQKHNAYISYVRTGKSDSDIVLKAPKDPGKYELRAFARDGVSDPSKVIVQVIEIEVQ